MKRKSASTIDVGDVKIAKTEATSFGPAFRRKLKTGSAITALQEFVAANKERNVVDDYVNAGGSVKELVDLFKQFDGHSNLTTANTIFSAITHVVSRIVSDLLLKQDAAEEACKELLDSHLSTLQNMLNGPSSTTSHKKVILKLLSAMVTLSGGLARIILSSFTFSFKSLKALTNPSSSSKSSQKLRTCFIHFLLSFLMEDNPVLIMEFLQKKGLLTSIIAGLIHDSPETVVLVLNTLRMKIVENMKISKTLKLHTFNTAVLRTLSKLYDVTEKSSNSEEGATVDDDVPELKINPVHGAVHELLLLLCTSVKKGILFRQQNNVGSANPNQLVLSLLEGIEKPWENDLKSHLVSSILKVCPEFVNIIFTKWKMDLHPRVSNEWNRQIDFVAQVLVNNKITSSGGGGIYFSINTLFPPFVQKLYLRNVKHMAIHEHPTVRYNLMHLLRIVLQNISESLKCDSTPPGAHEEVAQLLQKVVIPCGKLLHAWKLGVCIVSEDDATENEVHSNVPDISEYYLVLLDLLLLYESLIPICLVELRTSEVVNFEDYHTVVDKPEFRFKLARFVFATYNPQPMEPSFDFAMKQFVEYYAREDDTELHGVIENVLRSTGLFGRFESEIIVWLYVLKKYEFGDVFVEALSVAAQNGRQYFQQLTDLHQRFSPEETEDGGRTDLDNIDELENLFEVEVRSSGLTRSLVAVSPVVLAFLHILQKRKHKKDARKEAVQNFVSVFLIHLMHLQSSVKPLKAVVDENKSAYTEARVLNFISVWSQDDEVTDRPTYPSDAGGIIPSIYSCLLQTGSVNEVLERVNECEQTEAALAWNACIFYTVRLELMDSLDDEKRNDVSTILIQLLRVLPVAKISACLELLLTNRYLIDSFTIERTGRHSRLPLVLLDVVSNSVCESFLAVQEYAKLVSPYRHKFITLITNRRKRNSSLKINRDEFTIGRLVKFVALSSRTTINLLQLLIPMPVKKYLENGRPSEWSELIVCLLNAASRGTELPLDHEHFALLLSRLNEARKTDADVEELVTGIIEYVRVFSHHIKHIPEELVEDMCRNSSPQLYKLTSYLIAHHRSFADVLLAQIMEHAGSLDVEPLLEVLDQIQKVTAIDEKALESIRKLHLKDLTEVLRIEDNFWLRKKNRKWMCKILSTLSQKTSSKMCRKIETILPAVQLDEDKCALMRIIFEKADRMLPFMKLLLEKLNESLSSNQDALWLCEEISTSAQCETDLSELVTLPLWQSFVKLSLKVSLQTDNARIMRAFKDVCEKILGGDSTDASALIFQMTISHSAFVGRMLSNSALKIELIELLLVLTRLNPAIMSSNHVPLLLAAYRASLAKSDQLLLQLLQWYENNDVRFSDCRPYLWGDAAASHYSIRSEISVSLTRQPSPNQVLELFDMKVINNTIKHFPLDRPLWPKIYSPTTTDVTVYDPSFMLPLLSHLLAPESRISIQKFCRSGALCLVLTALSSEDSDVRMAGYHCLQRFDEHLFSREKEVQIWQQFLNALKNGLISGNSGEENGAEPPRLACLVTTFLANMSLIICEPLNSLYAPMSNFLLAKPSFDLNAVPNFFMLFYSTDLMHRDHQKWILKVIRDGMRYEKDGTVARRTFLFKFLLQYYGSSLSTASVNVIILQILANALEIEKCRLFLVTKCSLLSWITHIILNLTVESRTSFPVLLKILKSLISPKHTKSVSLSLILLLRRLKCLNVLLDQSISEELLRLLSTVYCSFTHSIAPSEQDFSVIFEVASPLLTIRSRKLFDNVLKYRSVLFLDELCGNNTFENCMSLILQQYVRNK